MSCELWTREQSVVNTDPQRRCYNGYNFSEEVVWSEWRLFVKYDTPAQAAYFEKALAMPGKEFRVGGPP